MIFVHLFLAFGSLLIPFSQGEDMWMLIVNHSPTRNSGNNVPRKTLWALSTPTRLLCAALCLQNSRCSFYGYRDHVCHGYISSGTKVPPSDIPAIMQRQFKKYKRKAVQDGYKRLTSGNTTLYVKGYRYLRNREEALQVCQAEGGTLVRLDSLEKVKLFKREFKCPFFGGKRFWIGLSDKYDNDTWYWTDGTHLSNYSNWAAGEPNNVYNGVAQNCVGIFALLLDCGEWYDENCSAEMNFVCEMI